MDLKKKWVGGEGVEKKTHFVFSSIQLLNLTDFLWDVLNLLSSFSHKNPPPPLEEGASRPEASFWGDSSKDPSQQRWVPFERGEANPFALDSGYVWQRRK